MGTSLAAQTLEPIRPTAPPLVYPFFLRAPSHINHSTPELFHNISDRILDHLRARAVSLARDEAGDKTYSQGEASLAVVESMAQDAGATYVLFVVVERPLTKWVKVTLHCYDVNGRLLWAEQTSQAGRLVGSEGLETLMAKLPALLDQHIGGPGLPVQPGRAHSPPWVANERPMTAR
ncbi:MAG TPA: hypothetical protein VGD59_09735 [Acidisarcina sp.]